MVESTLKLQLDYDCSERSLFRKWRIGVYRIYLVFGSKREYLPRMNVTWVDRTRKGFHVYCSVALNENLMGFCTNGPRWLTIIIQDVLGSDPTRSLFDGLRVIRGEEVYNLLFGWKNMRMVKPDRELQRQLNLIISETLLDKGI
jgi:hypothetical protein